MKKFIYIIGVLTVFASCSKDFLEVNPKTEFSDDNFWTNESNLKAFSYGLYSKFSGYGQGSFFGGDHYFSILTDDVIELRGREDFPNQVPATYGTAGWTWDMIRKANVLIAGAKKATVSEEVKLEYEAVGRFFRALLYWDKVERFGDVPFYGEVIEATDSDALNKERDDRVFVMEKILEDLDFAIANLKPELDKYNVNRWTALAAKSRIMLYAGTTLKYHGINAAKSQEFLQASYDASEEIINDGGFSIHPDYSEVFNSEDLKGNNEVIMAKIYNDGFVHSIKSFIYHEPYIGFSNSALSSFLMDDGTPISKDGATHPAYTEWVFNTTETITKSLLEYNTLVPVAEGRDPRMAEIVDTTRLVFLESNGLPIYSPIKYTDYEENKKENRPSQGVNGTSDAPIYRYGEVLLNYAEAAFELGVINQTILDNSINVLRDRVSMPHLSVAVGFVADDNKYGIDALLWEIRRERRVELMLEPARNNDLFRWKQGERYNDEEAYYSVKVDPAVKFADEIVVNKTADGHLYYQTVDSRRLPFEDKFYLYPLPADQLVLNPNLEPQNPGW